MIVPTVVRDAINRGVGEVTRGVQIFESDSKTLWLDGGADRLKGGSVSVTYGDNERRALDLTLRNDDNLLRSQPNGMWYDKVIKLSRGVRYPASAVMPRAIIIEQAGGLNSASRTASVLASADLTDVVVDLTVNDFSQVDDYDVIISNTEQGATTRGDLLLAAYEAGKTVITIGTGNTSATVPWLGATQQKTVSETWGISDMASPTLLSGGWASEAVGAGTGHAPTGLVAGATAVSRWQMVNGTYAITGSINSNIIGGKWLNIQLPSIGSAGSNFIAFLTKAISWIRGSLNGGMVEWSTQIGEFVIDRISSDHFPNDAKITGRDYVKRCSLSKIESPMSFAAGTSTYTLVHALAANAGITKFRMSSMPEELTSELQFDRGTPRWEVMRRAAEAAGYEIFFDNQGYLVTRKFLDPTLSVESEIFETGPNGNLSTYSRGVHDTRIYNHIVVYGDPPSGETRLPYVAQSINNRIDSPTSVDKIGDRYYSYASTFFTSEQQCQEYADRLLKLHALESYELNFSSINYPWMEVGEVAKIIDPQAVSTDPNKYLIDTLTIPLDLGPMSGTGKRVTMVVE